MLAFKLKAQAWHTTWLFPPRQLRERSVRFVRSFSDYFLYLRKIAISSSSFSSRSFSLPFSIASRTQDFTCSSRMTSPTLFKAPVAAEICIRISTQYSPFVNHSLNGVHLTSDTTKPVLQFRFFLVRSVHQRPLSDLCPSPHDPSGLFCNAPGRRHGLQFPRKPVCWQLPGQPWFRPNPRRPELSRRSQP